MSFDEVRLPTKIEFGALGGPRFRTEVVLLGSGHEQRNAEWSAVRGRWDVAPGIQSQSDLSAIIAFWYARQGRLRGFRFKDHTDFAVKGQVLIAGVQGGETSVQLVRTYASGGQAYTRTITKPVAGTVQLFLDGQPIASSVDTATGVATFAPLAGGSPSPVLTADFEFDVPVRFDTDGLEIRQVTHAREAIQTLPIVEIRDFQ
ncbi:MAG: DUF2460 domain-containing protein [Kiloniellaceae bacterium]